MRTAKLIANERISYKVIPQSLPFSNSSINWLSSGDAALESGIPKNQYSTYILFCIGVIKNVSISVFFYKCVCKDEHLAAIVQNPAITIEEIKNLPHSSNILLKEFAPVIHCEFQKILFPTG